MWCGTRWAGWWLATTSSGWAAMPGVHTLVTLGTPHQGTMAAYLLPTRCCTNFGQIRTFC